LNSFSKVSRAAIDLWLEILQAIPGSKLLLQAPFGSGRNEISERFAKSGLSPERLEFVSAQPWEHYVRTWQRVDVALDPFPYGGGITTCDALWMGVPVVSLNGRTAVGRGGSSILSNIGLPKLIADSPGQYREIATELAGDLPRLKELRSSLRNRMENSPLRNVAGFARDIELAFREMWRRWCSKKPQQ
jgi:predicted O-linked N-acetylglucosamine transferase (SPINDLY family)